MRIRRRLFNSPGRTILLSLLLIILVGTMLLHSSWAHKEPLSWLDALFTATSAVSVTGLMVAPLEAFTRPGQIIILALVQIGALGLITLTVFFLSLFRTMHLSTKHITGEALELAAGQNPRSLATFTMLFTITAECIGWFLCYICILPQYTGKKAWYISAFHAISSFCNYGVTPLDISSLTATMPYRYGALLSITACLVLIGSLGFIVWRELCIYVTTPRQHKYIHMSLHTRLVLSATIACIIITSIVLFMLEYASPCVAHPSLRALAEPLFNAICLRSAGFTTLPLATVRVATLFLIMILCFIGSSPGSTGSGVKVTTFAICIATIRAILLRKSTVEIKGRTIANEQVFKAIAILALSVSWLACTIFLLLITESSITPFNIMFEAFSAFTNLGVTIHATTTHLSWVGKLIIIISMAIGRIGSLTMIFALKKQESVKEFHYPEERVFMS